MSKEYRQGLLKDPEFIKPLEKLEADFMVGLFLSAFELQLEYILKTY